MCFFFKYGCSNLDSFLTLEEKSRTLDWGEVLTNFFSLCSVPAFLKLRKSGRSKHFYETVKGKQLQDKVKQNLKKKS